MVVANYLSGLSYFYMYFVLTQTIDTIISHIASMLKLLSMQLKSSTLYHQSTRLSIQNCADTFSSGVSCTTFCKLFIDLAKLWHKAWLHSADHFLKQLY